MAQDVDDVFGAPLRKDQGLHEIGQSVDALSLQELDERIELLLKEIERLEGVKKLKQSSLQAAAAFFKI